MEKKYWKSLEELKGDAEFVKAQQSEFAEYLPIEALGGKSDGSSSFNPNRRDFLKFMGFGVAAATLASCEAPVKKTIPYLVKPEEITPGVANWYASSYFDGVDYSSILVKTREGRPIKIEGNKLSTVTKGAVNARVHASVLSLYDSARLKTPLSNHNATDWNTVDKEIDSKLVDAVGKGKFYILSSTIISPSLKEAIAAFSARHANAKHVTYDAVSSSAVIEAHNQSFGKAVLPSYNIDKAEVLVGIGSDFLDNTEYNKQYVKNRKLEGKKTMSRHIQFETILSLTGANADKRYTLKPSEQAIAVAYLYNKIAAMAGAASVQVAGLDDKIKEGLDKTARELWAAKGKALVLAGANDVNVQLFVNAINSLLGSYGNTIDIDAPSHLRQGNDADLAAMIADMKKGEVGAILFYNTNPAYTLPNADEFTAALSKVALKISFADREDETAALCDYVCPDNHYLESWMDAEPKKGSYSLVQPTISPLFSTRSAIESFLKWSGNSEDAHTYISNYWKANIFGKQSTLSSFDAFWNKSVQDGVVGGLGAASAQSYKANKDLNAAAAAIAKMKNDGIEIELYTKAGVGTGNQANNPWLQELPDPISRVCWDNYVAISPRYAKELGFAHGNVVTITANGKKIDAPVFIQPGQAYKTIGLALGYGRTKAGKAGNGVGINAYIFSDLKDGQLVYAADDVKIEKTGKPDYKLASTQTHHTMMGRAIVKETSLAAWQKDPKAGNPDVLITTPEGKKKAADVNFWQSHDKPNHRWGLAIDLNSCTGCGACVVSCQAENNVPVVGKDEIDRSREMHWIRIDRYYTSDEEQKEGENKNLSLMEIPSDEPQVVFQPLMCQHCNHAPCETVCPVVATTHSSEGLNQMTYNRCIGTRYCANNCPYKVRRFNWFKYSDNNQFDFNMNDDLGKMVLNPDVVVRSRGVMEKCSMCVQRIQDVKLTSKKESRRPVDGEIQTACSQSCPSEAIVFGDFTDPNSRIAKLVQDERAYYLLEELDVQPSVFYQTKVRNA